MSDDHHPRVIEIASEPAGGSGPARVSLYIDGEHKFSVRTTDLKNIGDQLRGKRGFSFSNTVVPIIITLITLIGTTLIGQTFQYISWRNSTTLHTRSEEVQHALATLQKASTAIDKRFYATKTFLAAMRDLAKETSDSGDTTYKLAIALNQERVKEFYSQLESWNEDYNSILTAIDYTLDRPVNIHERVSVHDFLKDRQNNAPGAAKKQAEAARLH